MSTYSLEGVVPIVHPEAFVHPDAVLIGDVIVGARCYVGPGASLRGDFGRIVMGAGSNVQDNCVLHSFPGEEMRIDENAHIGHSAVLHGCTVCRDALVGISSVVMDGVVVREQAFVGAMSFVKAGFEVPPRTLVTGVPARIVRELSDAEIAWKANGTVLYQQLADRCRASLTACEPLTQLEPNRAQVTMAAATPLHKLK